MQHACLLYANSQIKLGTYIIKLVHTCIPEDKSLTKSKSQMMVGFQYSYAEKLTICTISDIDSRIFLIESIVSHDSKHHAEECGR